MGEGAIDHGGPRREFFRLLAQKSQECFFIGEASNSYFLPNVSAIQVTHTHTHTHRTQMHTHAWICETCACCMFYVYRLGTYSTSGDTSGCQLHKEDMDSLFLLYLCITHYLCTGKCTNVDIPTVDIPDPVLKFVLAKVNILVST